MLVDYLTISEDAKVWVYPSNRKFYKTEIEEVENKVKSFVENWKTKDENFKASYQFLYSRFLIFFAEDELSPISSSDIDALVSFILELQTTFNVLLLDRMNVCFKQGEFVQYKDLKDFKKLVKSKSVTKKTVIFDNLINNKFDFENHWEITIEESWYNRFL